jgi:DNA-binding transcriptional LysR family regulator
MERELKVQLFRRLPRGVELTSAGHALLPEAKAMLARLDRALESTRRAARGEQGSLCVGIAPTAPFNPLVPRAIRSFREAFPMVSLVLEEGLSKLRALTMTRWMSRSCVRGRSMPTELW